MRGTFTASLRIRPSRRREAEQDSRAAAAQETRSGKTAARTLKRLLCAASAALFLAGNSAAQAAGASPVPQTADAAGSGPSADAAAASPQGADAEFTGTDTGERAADPAVSASAAASDAPQIPPPAESSAAETEAAERARKKAPALFGNPFRKPESFREILSHTSVTLSFEPSLLLNTASGAESAPSPAVYPLAAGAEWPDDTFVSFQPRLAFFASYYLWDGDDARPAEIESRTVTAFSFLIDLPAGFTLHPAERHFIEAGCGPAFLLRFGCLSSGVSGSDDGKSGTASGDASKINGWFWSSANFLYLNLHVSYLFQFTDTVRAGPEFRFYLPLGSVFSGSGMDGAIFSLGIKVRLF